MWTLTIRARSREEAVAMYRYLQKVFAVQKNAVAGVSATVFSVRTTKPMGEIMIKAIRDKFEEAA